MPTYEFENTETGEQFEIFCSWKEREGFLKDNPHVRGVIITAPTKVSTVGERTGLGNSGGFNEVLSKVGEKFPNSPLDRQTRRRTATEVKRDNVIKKHGLDKL